jgi:hypothetical protein
VSLNLKQILEVASLPLSIRDRLGVLLGLLLMSVLVLASGQSRQAP